MGEVTLCNDGVYRWTYELSLYTNPAILILVLKVLAISMGITWLIVAGIEVMDGYHVMENLIGITKAFGLVFLVMMALGCIGYLVYALSVGGKYCVLFEMDEKGINHIQQENQVKKNDLMMDIAILAGLAKGNPTLIGAGMMGKARTSMYTAFKDVKSVEPVPSMHLIKVNETVSHNQVYADGEDFDFVLSYIKTRTGL